MPLIWRVLERQPVGSLSNYIDMGGGIASRLARQAPPDEIIELLCSSGLRGRGGAGFPTGTKWKTVAASRPSSDVVTVVVNAAEGEPGTFKDRTLLRTNPYRVLEGAIVAAITMQTERVRIGIKATFGREIERLTGGDGRDARKPDGSMISTSSSFEVRAPTCSARRPHSSRSSRVVSRFRGTPPYRRGLQEGDTRSAAGVRMATVGGAGGATGPGRQRRDAREHPLIVERGPEWFREIGTERSPGTIVCTVEWRDPPERCRRGPYGIDAARGDRRHRMGTATRPRSSGRPGWHRERSHPRPAVGHAVDLRGIARRGSGLGSAGFIVFDDTTEPAAIAAGVARFLAVESCGQCEPCKTDGLLIADQLNRSLRHAVVRRSTSTPSAAGSAPSQSEHAATSPSNRLRSLQAYSSSIRSP